MGPHHHHEISSEVPFIVLGRIPRVSIKLRQWVMENLFKMNCENVQKLIIDILIPEIFQTFLKNEIYDNSPYFEEF